MTLSFPSDIFLVTKSCIGLLEIVAIFIDTVLNLQTMHNLIRGLLLEGPGPNCIKGFDGYRHLTGIFWPTRFDVTIETIVSIVMSNLIGQN